MFSWLIGWLRRLICLLKRWLFARIENSFKRSECIYEWGAAYRVDELPGCQVTVTVRIRLNPDADVTAQEVANLCTTWEQGIEQRWSNEFQLARSRGDCSCSSCTVNFDVQWVTSGEHHTVRVRRGPARSNMLTWNTSDDGGAASHEFGHMLGFIDEYADPNCPNRTVATDNSIMLRTAGDPQRRHYQPWATWISNWTCCTYVVF